MFALSSPNANIELPTSNSQHQMKEPLTLSLSPAYGERGPEAKPVIESQVSPVPAEHSAPDFRRASGLLRCRSASPAGQPPIAARPAKPYAHQVRDLPRRRPPDQLRADSGDVGRTGEHSDPRRRRLPRRPARPESQGRPRGRGGAALGRRAARGVRPGDHAPPAARPTGRAERRAGPLPADEDRPEAGGREPFRFPQGREVLRPPARGADA